MKRSINRWTMSLATAGVLALPVTSFAKVQEQAPQQQQQQPQPAQPQPEQPPAQPPAQPQPDRPQQPPTDPQPQPTPQPQPQPAQPQPTQPQPTEPQTPQPTAAAAQPAAGQSVSPQEHIRQAQQAVDAISATSVPAKNRSDLAKLKQHLSNLEKMGSSPSATAESSSPGASKSASAPKANWGTEVAAIDKIITEMVGSETSSPTSTPGATGTAGASKASTAVDDATKAKLMEVRTHITAYAAGMAGAPSTPKTEAATTAASPAAAATEPAAASPSPAASQQPSATPSSSQNPAAGAQNPPATQPDPNAAQQPPAAGQASTAGQPPVNADEAHRHLVTARDTLSQLTQLPAAAQLNGEARTQVSQLISNFNELIANPPDWRASYQKVAANLTTLLGSDNSDAEAQAGAPTNPTATPANPTATSTPGAVGTAGATSIEIDPSIRAKLVEFRRSLNQFEKAAGTK